MEELERRDCPSVTLYVPTTLTNLAGDGVSEMLSGSSSDYNPVSFTATGLPPGLSLGSGVISGTIANNAARSTAYVVTVTGTDTVTSDSATATIDWTVNPPVITLYGPGDQTNLAGDSVDTMMSGSSSDGYALTYTEMGIPPGLSFDSTYGTISGTIPNNAASSTAYAVIITATDASSGVSASTTFNWTVNPPVITLYGPGDQTNLAGDSVDTMMSGSSSDGYALTYTETGVPPGLSFDSTYGTISGTIPNDAASGTPYAVTVTATDASSGVSASTTFNWTVNPPVITLSPDSRRSDHSGRR